MMKLHRLYLVGFGMLLPFAIAGMPEVGLLGFAVAVLLPLLMVLFAVGGRWLYESEHD